MIPYLFYGVYDGAASAVVTPTSLSAFAFTNNTGHTTQTVSVTVTTEDYISIVCSWQRFAACPAISGVTVNGVAATAVAGTDGGNISRGTNNRSQSWEFVAPTPGTYNVVVTFASSTQDSHVVVQGFTGVNQTTPSRGGLNAGLIPASGSAKLIAPTSTTANGNYLIGNYINSGSGLADVTANDTQISEVYDTNNGTIFNTQGEAVTGAGASLSWSDTTFFDGAGHVYEIVAATGSPPVILTGVGASKSALTANARGFKIASGIGASKVGTTGSAIGQSNAIPSGLGAAKTGAVGRANGFKLATGIGASQTGNKNNANGVKTAQSQSVSNNGYKSSASGLKIGLSTSSAKVGVDNSASGTKTAQSIGVSKVGSTANVIGTSALSASGIGASNGGSKSSVSGIKTTQSNGESKQGTKSNANGLKVASGVGASKVGTKGNARGVAVTIQSTVGTAKVGTTGSARGVKTSAGQGSGKQASASTTNGFKIAIGVGASRSGVVSRPSGEVYIPTLQKKIRSFRGPEWITVSQGFWNS